MHDFTKKKWNAFGSATFHPSWFLSVSLRCQLWGLHNVICCFAQNSSHSYWRSIRINVIESVNSVCLCLPATWQYGPGPASWCGLVPAGPRLTNSWMRLASSQITQNSWTAHEHPVKSPSNMIKIDQTLTSKSSRCCPRSLVWPISVKDVFQFAAELFRMNMCERIYFTVDVSGTSNLLSRFVHPWRAWLNRGWTIDIAAWQAWTSINYKIRRNLGSGPKTNDKDRESRVDSWVDCRHVPGVALWWSPSSLALLFGWSEAWLSPAGCLSEHFGTMSDDWGWHYPKIYSGAMSQLWTWTIAMDAGADSTKGLRCHN